MDVAIAWNPPTPMLPLQGCSAPIAALPIQWLYSIALSPSCRGCAMAQFGTLPWVPSESYPNQSHGYDHVHIS